MTNSPLYTEIYGLICTPVVQAEGIEEPKGGELKTDDIARPRWDYGSSYHQGRTPRTWTANFRFLTEEDLDEFMDFVNNAPEGVEFYPRRDDRCAYVKFCHAEILKPEEAKIGGVWTTYYKAKATIKSIEPWVYGPVQGIPFDYQPDTYITLPQTASLQNDGIKESGLDYLMVSGGYSASLGYTDNLLIRLTPGTSTSETDKQIILCSTMMRADAFEVDRWGHVLHSYASIFDKTYANLQIDLWGSSYCSGGSIAAQILTIGNIGKLIMPFSGPLPISGENPYIEIYVTALSGAPSIKAGVLSNLSDLATVTTTLQLGYNKISVPNYQGKTDFYMGIVCGASDSISLSSLKGCVARYIAPSLIPVEDPGQSFVMRVEDASTSNHLITALKADYRDVFWM